MAGRTTCGETGGVQQRFGKLRHATTQPDGGAAAMKSGFSVLLAVAALGCAAGGSRAEGQRSAAQRHADQTRATELRTAAWQQADAIAQEVERRIEAGTAAPEADAMAAAERGEFGLMAAAGRFGRTSAPGALCFTPGRQPARSVARFHYGDVIAEREVRWFAYADAYNRALISRSDYPDADLCRAAGAPNTDPTDRDERAAAVAARQPGRPPRTLHEAARWGTAADVRHLLGTGPIDAPDGVEMSPLAWAVTRGNRPAAEVLLTAGADPWSGPEEWGGYPVYLAAALGRGDWFAMLAARPGRPFERWSNVPISAAVAGGDPAILALMLREPHEPVRVDMLRDLPSLALAEMLLRDTPAMADALLRRAVERASRADLVRLALAHGANPEAPPPQAGMETPLGSASTGIGAQSPEIVDLLLRAGADPDAFSFRTRPLWRAVGILHLDDRVDEIDARASAIFRRLLAAGADINLPDADGVPPVRTLLFPYRWDHRRLDASFVTPALLEMLVGAGLDLNARWQGERVLGAVERQAGRDSELAITLRRLGARH